MRTAKLPFLVASASLWALLCGSSDCLGANKHPSYNASRTPDDEPDLRGIWEISATANRNIEGHPARNGVAASKSIIVDPANGRLPYLPDARTKRESMNLADDPQAKCYMAGVPRIMYTPGPFQIFQSAGLVMILHQDLHTYRYVPTVPRPQATGGQFWMGSSRGKWDGDTLVIDSVSFNDQTWFDKAANFHSDEMHVVERFTLTGPNTLQYEALVEDPRVFARPWTIRLTAKRHTEPGFHIIEDECLKDDKGVLYHTARATR